MNAKRTQRRYFGVRLWCSKRWKTSKHAVKACKATKTAKCIGFTKDVPDNPSTARTTLSLRSLETQCRKKTVLSQTSFCHCALVNNTAQVEYFNGHFSNPTTKIMQNYAKFRFNCPQLALQHFNIFQHLSTSFNTWCFSAEICFAHRPQVPWTRTRLVHRCHETWKGWAATVARRSLGNSSHPIFRCTPAVTPAFDIMFLMVSYGFLWYLMVSYGFL